MDFGAFVGIGYLLSEEELDALVANLTPEQYIKFRDNVWCYDVENGKHFFGEIVYRFDEWGEAKSIETLATLPALQDDVSFGLKYGELLFICPSDEIDTGISPGSIDFFNTHAAHKQ